MKSRSHHSLRRTLSLVILCAMALSLFPVAAFAAGEQQTIQRTYYVSTSGKGSNNGLSEAEPLPGLDAIPWNELMPGDRVLLKKGDTFPGAIRVVNVHGTADAPITIGAYGTTGDAPKIEARGQGIWLQETGSTNILGKYASAGVLLYDCSYITVNGLDISNRPDPLKAAWETTISGKSNVDTLAYSGVAVAADGKAAAEGIVLRDITVHGDGNVQAVITETSSNVTQTGVTKGAEAPVRTFKDASGTYYVSSLNGSDSNDGSSPDKAFYSLHKINELNLQPGAKVYLERGSVFENQYLHIEGSGAEGSPIIIDSYGKSSDPAPVINTNGDGVWYQNHGKNLDNSEHVRYGYTSSSINLFDVAYIEIKNIAMTNYGTYGQTVNNFQYIGDNQVDGGTVPGETGYNTNGSTVGSYTWGGKMSRTGVSGVAKDKGTVHHIYLQNLDIENIYGNVYIKHMNNGGIYFTVALPADEATTGISKFDDVRIEGCYVKRTSRWGITAAYTGAYCGQFGGAAISDETCEKYGMTNLYIGHNYLEEVGGDPITAMYALKPVIEYNVSTRGAREICSTYHNCNAPNGNQAAGGNKGTVAAGIWPWKCKTALFQYNECFDMLNVKNGNGDGQAWDADSGDSTIYQYNYSSGNTGGCIMFCAVQAYNSVFRYNISYGDGSYAPNGQINNSTGIIDMAGNPNGQIYNNTFLMLPNVRLHYRTSGPAQTENNIFYNLGENFDPKWRENTNITFNNNIYYGFGTSPDNDSKAIVMTKGETLFAGDVTTAPTAPKATDKNGLGTVNGIRNWSRDWNEDFEMFKLASGAEKAINKGVGHSFTGLTQDSSFGVAQVPVTEDFYGNELDNVHDIGAHDTMTAGGEITGSACELLSSLYEIRGTGNNELQVPFTTQNPLKVEGFVKGLTVSDGATVKVYSSNVEQAGTANIAAGMTVKIVATDGTENSTVYTIAQKNVYKHKADFVQNQQGNVWFHQTRVASTGELVNLTKFAGGAQGYWTGSNNTCAEYIGAADDDTASRTYNGTGFVFRAPTTGKVTVSFLEQPKFRNTTASGNSFNTSMIIYVNGVKVESKEYLVPKPASGATSTTAVSIPDFDLTVMQGDTIEFMVVNSGEFTSNHVANSADVTFDVSVTYKDEEVTGTLPDTKKPTAPSGLRVTDVTENSAVLKWIASTDNVGVDHYEVGVVGGSTATTTDLTHALTGLTADTEYSVTVKAVDAAGNESAEATVTFRTVKAPDKLAPSTPTRGKAVSVTSKTATISWTASTDNVGVEGYEVTVNGKTETVRNMTQITVSGLMPSTKYTVSVTAFDAAGNRSTAHTFEFTTAAPDSQAPTVPANLSTVHVSQSTATLRWDPSTDNEGVAGYRLKVGENGEALDVGNVLSYTVDGLEGYTNYAVYVCAYDEAGNTSNWAKVTFQTEGSSECEMISTLFEIRDGVVQIPYTDLNPLTLEEFRAAFTVSEGATVKVYKTDGTELTEGNVIAGMTVKVVAMDGTENSTAYTTALKDVYNSFLDWVGNRAQGNVWFYQYQENGAFVDHSAWDTQYNCWSDQNKGYVSVERNQACGSINKEAGSGFTFRAPANGSVTVNLWNYQTQDDSATGVENQVKKRADTSTNGNTITPYLRVYINGENLESKAIALNKNGTVQTTQAMTFMLEQGDTLSVVAFNEGPFGNVSGNNGVYFNPVVTYNNEVYVPNPKSVEIVNETNDTTIYTNATNNELGLPHTVQLTANVLPAGANQTVTWSSSNPQYATVDANGLVTAVADGTTNISATSTAGWKTVVANHTIEVRTRIEEITVKKNGVAVGDEPIKIYVNENLADHPNSVALTAETRPSNPTLSQLNWVNVADVQGMISLDPSGNGSGVTITAIGSELNVGGVEVRVQSAAHPEVGTNFTVHVFRALENNVYVTGENKVGSTLTASTVSLVMKDEAKAALSYQWYRGEISENNKIPEATQKQYVVTEEDIGEIIFVTVTANPDTFYEGTREAQTEQAIAKMDGPAAPTGLDAVNCTADDDGHITGLDASKVYEYKLSTDGDDAWETVSGVTTIDNLPAGNYQVRFKATNTQAASAPATVTIMPADANPFKIIAAALEGGTIGLSATQAEAGTEIIVTLTPNTGYELVKDSLSVTYTDDEGEHEVDVTDGVFTMPEGNVTVTAEFAKKTFVITHDLPNVTCSLGGGEHVVKYGEQPVITLNANPGYTMPSNLTVTKTDSGEPFYGYIYSHSSADPDTATLTFTAGITEDLTVSGEIPEKTFTVNYPIQNLQAPVETAPRTVGYKKAYTGKLVAEEGYRLPRGIEITMGGQPFTDFDYDSETGVITIAEGKITGNLVIVAIGMDATIPAIPVTGISFHRTTLTVYLGRSEQMIAYVTPENATNPNVVWLSSDPSVAEVDQNGKITAVALGVTDITATTDDGHYTATCHVTVIEEPVTPPPGSGGGGGGTGGGAGGGGAAGGGAPGTRRDGAIVTTVTNPDGSTTETVKQTNGTVSQIVTDVDGDVTITVTDSTGEEIAKVTLPATIPTPDDTFIDLDATPWAKDAINHMAGLKLVNGVGGSKYDPTASMTRGSLATVLYRLSNGKNNYAVTFKDVAKGQYYTEGVAWAAKAGVVTGYTEDTFAPNDTITREQLAVMLARYAKLIGMDTTANKAALDKFTDGARTGGWAADGMAWCVEKGILQGKGANNLDPTAKITRAEVAVMLDRFIALIK